MRLTWGVSYVHTAHFQGVAMKNQLRLPLAAQSVIDFYQMLDEHCEGTEPTLASLIGQDEQDVASLVETICESDMRIFQDEEEVE
jgi:hypothetical protein